MQEETVVLHRIKTEYGKRIHLAYFENELKHECWGWFSLCGYWYSSVQKIDKMATCKVCLKKNRQLAKERVNES